MGFELGKNSADLRADSCANANVACRSPLLPELEWLTSWSPVSAVVFLRVELCLVDLAHDVVFCQERLDTLAQVKELHSLLSNRSKNWSTNSRENSLPCDVASLVHPS